MKPSLRLPLALAVLTTPTVASGGVSIFIQNAELHILGFCLVVLVFLTVTFETVIHRTKHWVEGWVKGSVPALAVIAKVNSELTVLGFISALVLVTVNVPNPSPHLGSFIASLEVAHLWLFFVGLMFVLEAILLLRASKTAQDEYTKFEKTSNLDLLMEEIGTTPKSDRASLAGILCCGECDVAKGLGGSETGIDNVLFIFLSQLRTTVYIFRI